MIQTPSETAYFVPSATHIFLAGTIDNGASVDWQSDFADKLGKGIYKTNEVIIYNPRNKEWDPTMEPVMSNPAFANQVDWEHTGLCYADYIIMNFLPNSKSPITLLELGMFADSGKLLVICPEGFYRKGNVDHTCALYNIPQFENIEQIIDYINK